MIKTTLCLLTLFTSLCSAVVITPQSARPWLVSGPADKEDIKARLAVFPYPTSAILNAYLYGTEAEKQAQTTSFFNSLPNPFVSARRTAEYLSNYDIVLAMGYATPGQQQIMRDRSAAYAATVMARFPAILPPTEYTNGALEEMIALGSAALNFPDHPDAQIWIDRSVDLITQQLNAYYEPDGPALESPNYHQWELSLLARFLSALRRCTDADLLDHPGLRNALEWLIRFSTPPHAVGNSSYTIPAWGDTWYSRYYQDLPAYAAAYQDSDPDFSMRLMHWWRKVGSQVNTGWDFPTVYPQLIDPRLPDAPPAPFASTYSPRRGQATLRAETGGPDEFFATFACGQNGVSHHNTDHSQIELFAFGVPLALDSAGGPYDTGSPTSTMKSWNRQTMAHNVVRCVVPEPSNLRDMSGQFQAFGSSAIADYVVGQTPYGPTSIRHMVMMKGEYLVVWDQITAATYSEWFFHTPAQSLEWQAHKVVSHTAWNVDLDIHFLLPAAALPAPTVASSNISVDYTTRNALASEAPVPTTAKLYTGQGEGRFGNWTDPADTVPGNDNWDLKWLKYLFVRSPSADGDYLTVMQPRKVGVTPALTTTLVSSSATGVSLTVNYNGRVDEITIDTNGATVTKGGETVQFAKAVPQSGVSGAARYVLSNNTTTTLTNALTTTGAVDVVTGTLALGNSDLIPDIAPLIIRPGGTLDLQNSNEGVSKLTMDCGRVIGSGTLNVGSIDWFGGTVSANLVCSGAFTKKGGATWSPSPFITYAGDTIIESGTVALKPGAATLSGTDRLVLGSGTSLTVSGTGTSIASLEVTGDAKIDTGSDSLAVGTSLTGGGVLTISGNLDLSTASIASTVSLGIRGTVSLPPGAGTVSFLSIDGVVQPAGIAVNASTHPGIIVGSGSLTPLAGLGIPSGLNATASPGSVALAWSAVADATAYSIRRSTTPGGPYVEVGVSNTNGFTDTTVTNGVTYHYVVAARIAAGDGVPSAEASAMPTLPTWTGSVSTAWENGGNWLTTNPTSAYVARFTGPLTANQPSVSGANSVGGLLFDSPGWTVNSTSAGTLTIGADGVVLNATSGTTTLNKAVTILAGTRTWKGKTGSTLVMASLAGPTATSNLQWGVAGDPDYQGTLKLTYNGNGPNINLFVLSGTVQAHKTGWINNRDLNVSGGTFLVTSSNGDLIRGEYGVTLNSGLIQWGGFNEAFKALTLNGGNLRGSGSTLSLSDLSGAIARVSGNITLGHADDLNPLTITRLGTNGSLDLGNAMRALTVHSPVELALPVTNGGLTKLGASTLTLSGANTYGGGTTINAGSLATGTAGTLGSGNVEVAAGAVCDLRNPAGAVADTASVYLTESAKVMLSAGVSERVAKLYVDGVLAKTGTWNASRDPVHFAGAGEMIVTDGEPLTPTEIWREEAFGTIDNSGNAADFADPDGDGTVNRMERALGMNPNGRDSGNLPAIDTTVPGFAFTFTKSRAASDLTIVIEESSALSSDSWTGANGTTELADDSHPDFQRIRFTPAQSPATRKFYRLRVLP